MPDRWTSKKVLCRGGLNLEQDILSQGEANTGSAKVLQNYEPALEGGYRRVDGFTEWSSSTVTGTGPILGVKVALDNVFAARENVAETGIHIFKSSGSGWTQITSTALSTDTTKVRFTRYFLTEERIIFTTGFDSAWKYNNTTLTEITGNDAPATPKYSAFWNNRIVLADDTSIYISAPSDDTDFRAASGGAEINVGDKVKGIAKFRETLYVFCENSIRKLIGYSNADFAMDTVTHSIGCVAGDTIQEIAGDLLFLAPDGLRTIAATERIGDIEFGLQSQQIQPLVRPKINDIPEDGWNGLVVRKKSQYRMLMHKSGVSDGNAEGWLGRVNAAASLNGEGWEWATLNGINAYCTDSEYLTSQTDEVVVFGHPSDGKVYRMERGDTFGGANIKSIYRTPDITFDDATIRKVMQKIDLYTQVEGDLSLSVAPKFDLEGANILQPQEFCVDSVGNVSTYGTAVYGTSTYSAAAYPVFKKNLVGSGFTVAFVFSSNDDNPPHRIDSFQIQYAVKGRR